MSASRRPVFSDLPKFLTIRQTAKILHVHPNTLRAWDRKGKLRAVRFGSRHDRRYLRDEVAAAWALTYGRTPIARPNFALPPLRRYAPALGLFLLLLGSGWAEFSSAATEPATVEVYAQPRECSGWVQASAATKIELSPKSDFNKFSIANSAQIRSQDLGFTTDAGAATATFDRVDPELTCAHFSLDEKLTGSLSGTTVRIFLGTNGQLNSTDALKVSWSLDGKDWALVATESVKREEQQPIVIDLPAVTDSQRLADLRVRLQPDFSLNGDSSVFVDGVRVEARLHPPEPTPSVQSAPARQKELDRLTAFSKASYESDDQPEVTVPKQQTKRRFLFGKKVETWKLKDVSLIDSKSESMSVDYRSVDQVSGDDTNARLRLRMSSQHPGKYILRITMISPTGTIEVVEKTFLWGVLAVNITRANPAVGQTQLVGIGVLDDTGRTICDASVQATVTDPKGRKTQFETRNGSLKTNPTCVDKGVTNEADYHFALTLEQAGVYRVSVTADTTVGERKIEENFITEATQPFTVERVDYPTRIFPPAEYPVRIAITPKKDYLGLVTEEIPTDFTITNIFPAGTLRTVGTTVKKQFIEWLVEWKAGQTYYLTYTFDAPDISPALFLTGPLTIGGSFIAAPDFQESRQWQIASDAISANGNFYYGDTTNAGKIKMTPFTTASTYGTEVNVNLGPAVNIMHVVAKTAPTREEKMIGYISGNPTTDGRLDIVTGTTGFEAAGDYTLRWTATSVTDGQDCDAAPTAGTCTQAFDLGYEQLSGRGLVVYAGDADASGAPDADKIYYALWDGSAWSPDTTPNTPSATNELSLPGTGATPRWIRVVPAGDNLADERSNRAVVLVADSDDDLYAYYWDGSTFDAGTELFTTLGNCASARCFDGNWQGNNTFIVNYTNSGVSEVRYQKYSVGSGWGGDTQAFTTAATPSFLFSAADPTSSRIMIANFTSGNDTRGAVWRADDATDGWTVCASGGCPDTAAEGIGGPQAGIAFERFSGEALHVFNDAANGTAQGNIYMTYTPTSTWSATSTTGITPSDDHQFTKLIPSPNSDDIMVIAGDVDCDVDATMWGGSAPSTVGSNFELLLSSSNGSCANSVPIAGMMTTGGIDFAWNIYSPWGLNWRWTGDTTTANPGSYLANENVTPTGVADATTVRLRYGFVNRGTTAQALSAEGRKKLQYTSDDPETLTATWADVDADDGAGIWRYNNCTAGTDDSAIPSAVLTAPSGGSNIVGDFIEGSGNITQTHSAGPAVAIENDYCIESNGATGSTTYYFRAFDNEQQTPVWREQDNDGANDCATAACTYPSLSTAAQTITVSGTCDAYDQTTNCADLGDIRVAVGGTLQSQLDTQGGGGPGGTDGTFSITSVPKPSANAIVTVFVDGAPATASNRAVAITKYDGSGSISGLQLFKEHLTIGSADTAATLTSAELGSYDNSVSSSDADVFHDYNGSTTFTVDSTGFSTQEELYIGSGWTYRPDSGGGDTLTTTSIEIAAGTLTLDSNTFNVGGSFDNDGVLTASTSTTNFTAASGTNTIDADGTAAEAFYNVVFNDSAGSATYQLTTVFDADNNVTITGGNFDANSNAVTVGGSWDNDDTFTSGTQTTTFNAPSGTKTIDADGTGADSFSSIVFNDAAGSAVFQLTTAMDVNVDLTITGGNLQAQGNQINIGGVFDNDDTYTHGNNLIVFDATSGTKSMDTDGTGTEALYDVTFNDGGGSATFEFSQALDIDHNVTITGGTFSRTGSFTVGGSWDNDDYFFGDGVNNITFDATSGTVAIDARGNYVEFSQADFSMRVVLNDGGGSAVFQMTTDAIISNGLAITGGELQAQGHYIDLWDGIFDNDDTFTHGNGTIYLEASSGTNIHDFDGTGTDALYNLQIDDGGGTATHQLSTLLDVDNNLTIVGGTLNANSQAITVGGNWDNDDTFTSGTATVTFDASDTDNTIDADGTGTDTFSSVTFAGGDGSGTWTLTTAMDVTVAMNVDTSDILSIDSGMTLSLNRTTTAQSLTLNGTIQGAGRLTYQLPTSVATFPTTGTISSILRFDATTDVQTVPERTYGGNVELYEATGGCASRTFTLATTAGQTLNFSGDLSLIEGNCGGVPVAGNTNNPIVNITGNLTQNASTNSSSITGGTQTWTVSGSIDLQDGAASSSITNLTLNGTTKTIAVVGSLDVTGTLTIDGSYTVTASATSNLYVSGTLIVNTGKTLAINSGQSFLCGGTVTLTGTAQISGAGTLTVASSSLGTGGTLSSIVRFDVSGGDVTMPNRTYGGAVEVFMDDSATAAHKVIMAGGTQTLQSSLYVIDNSNTYNLTLDASNGGANNPTVTVTGDVDFTGTGTGSEALITGTGTWTVGGNIDFTGGTFTATSGNTMEMTGASKTITTAGSALHHLTVSAGSVTASGATTLNGNMLISGGSFAGPAAAFNVAGNWTNSGGTYVEGTGTVTLNGATSTTLNSGCSNTDSCANNNFYNLEINKTDAADGNDNVTLDTNGINVANTLTITDGELVQGALNVRAEGATAVSIVSTGKWSNISTGDIKLGGTATNNGTWLLDVGGNSDGCGGGDTDDITLTTTDGATQRSLAGSGTFTWYDVSVSYMNATVAITVNGGTNVSNNAGSFTFNACGITITGTIYSNSGGEASAVYNCSSDNLTIHTSISGGTSSNGTCTAVGGTFSIVTNGPPSSAGDPIVLWIDSVETPKATTVTLAADTSSNISGLNLIQDRLILTHENGGPMTNAKLSTGDNGNAGIRYAVSGSNLTVESGMELHVASTKAYTPGGMVTTTASASPSSAAGDVHVVGTMTMGTYALSVGGDLTNGGTLSLSSGQTTTMTATGSGFTITAGGASFQGLTFNGASGGWTNSGALTVSEIWTGTAGGFTQANSTTITVNGTAFSLANGFTWTKATSGANLILENATNLDFTDSNTTKQDLGAVQIGASPGVTTLKSDMSATTVTIPTSDTLNTKGWDITASGAFDCQGTCTLNLTDTAPNNETDGTIIDVGGDFTMSSSATFTSYSNSTVYLNSTSGTDSNRTFTTGGKAYNNVELKNAGATNDDITISGTPFDINGTLTLTDGQVRLDTNDPNVTLNGNLSINANATVTKADNGTATWTFDGATSPTTWTDGTGSGGQDIGLAIISGTTKTVNLASSAKATKLTIAASQVFGLGSSGYTFTLTGSGFTPNHPLQNSGTLNEGTNSTVKFTGTSDSDIDPEAFHHLEISPSGAGSPTFTFDVAETANPTTVAGNMTIGDSTNAVSVQLGTFSELTVDGNITISTNGTLLGSTDVGLNLGGSYTNNGTFTDAGNGINFTATTTGKTIAGNLTGSNKFFAIFSGSGGEWTNTSAAEFTDLAMLDGTLAGSNNITVNGGTTGTAGIINRSGGTFTLNPASTSSFGPSTASTSWTFNNLTFTTTAGSQITTTVTTCSTCTFTVNGAMSVDAKVTLTIASSSWTVVGSLTTTTTGAIAYTGTPTVTVQGTALGGGTGNIYFYNLTKSGAGTTTWSGTGVNAVRNTLTLSAGTLVAPSNTLYVNTFTESGGAFTHNSGTVMFNTEANQTLTASSTFNNVTFNDGLVGWWNLDETAGTSAADSSGYGHTGTHTNTPTISTDVPTVNFANSRSLDFNGTTQYVDLGTAPFINTEFADKITLSAWAKPANLTNSGTIIGKSFDTNHSSPFYHWNLFQTGSQICFRVGSTNICSATSTLTTSWQLITGVYDGSNMYLYRNGTQVATTAKTGNVGNGLQSARIAGRDTPGAGLSEYFAGKIDDVRIYRRALSSGEVTTLSNGDEWGLTGATWTLGADLTLAGTLGIKTGTLDTHVTNNRSITVGSSWLNDGGVFTARAGTVTMNAGSSGKTITAGQQSFYLLNLNNASGGWTMSEVYTTPTITVSNNMVITAGTLTSLAGTLSVGGDFNNAGTFTHNSGTVTMTGSSKNITGGSATTFNNLTISGTTGVDAAGSDATVASQLTVDNTKTLTINSGRTVTLSGTSGTTLSLVGTITGAGRLTYKNNATAFPATGTISSILRMDATAGDQSIGGTNSATRTFGGLVEIYSNSAGTAKTVTLENGTARTFAFSGALNIIADNTQDLTLTADTATDPTVTVTGDIDFTGTGGGSEILVAGSGTWTVSGNVDFTAGTYTSTSGNKLVMNGTSKTLTSASQALYDFEVSAGTVAISDATTISRDMILSGGTLTGPSGLTVSVGRDWTKTSGSYTANTGTVALTTSTSATISGSNTFYNLSVTGIGAAKTVLTVAATTQTVTGTWTVTGASGQLVTINAATAAQWNVNPTAASLDYVDISYTNNQGSTICATHSQSTSGNNTAITVTAGAGCGITISGVIRQSSNETSAYDCSANTLTIGAVVNGGTSATADCTLNTGVYSINAANAPSAAGDPIVVYINNGETPIGTTVSLSVDTSSNITNLDIIDGRLVTTYENAGPMTNAKMATGDNGNAGIRYSVATGNLTVESGIELHVKSGKTFTPGGTVTTTATGTTAGPAGDLHIAGTLTMGTNALTVGGDYNNAGTFNKTNTQTTTLAATGTGFTITPGTGDMNNLTVSGDAGGNGTYTLSGANLTVDGILNVNTGDTLAIDTSRTLTNSGSTDASISGTISGAGTLRFVNGSGGPGTGGTISVLTLFDASSGDIASTTVDARTYSATVELYASSSSDRTITLPSSTITLSGSSSHLHMKADGAGDLTVDGAANNPTVTVGGDIALNGTGGGVEAWVAGDNTWTSSGNVDTAQGFYAPHMAVLNPTWDNYGYEQDDYADDGFGGCDFLGTSSNAGTSSSTSLTQGYTTGASTSCSPSGTDFRYRSYLKFNLSGISNTNTVTRADLQIHASAAGGAFTVYRSNNDAPDGVAAGSLYAVGLSTGLNSVYSYATGVNMIPMALDGMANIQSSLGNAAYAVVLDGSSSLSTLTSTDSATNKPKLRVGYVTTATTPTLVMNGTGTLSGGTQSGFYNLTMSGTNTFNASHEANIYNTLTLSGSITTNSAPVVMAGSASTVIGGNNTLGNLTVSGGTTTLTTSDLTTSLNVQLLSSGTLSIASGRTFTAQGNVLLNSGTTISGAGTLTMTSTSSGPGTAGTLSSVARYDATGGNIANTTLDARTYGGAVEFYSNSGSARTVTAPSSGTFIFSSSVTTSSVGGNTLTVDLDDTTDPTVTIAGATTLGANTTMQAPSSTTLTLNGNYTNNGTFTDNSGTVALAGSAQQTLSGTMTGSSDFNNLTVTNASGSNPESSPSVIFGAAASAAGTFTATTADTKLRFTSSATYTFLNVTMNGQAIGTRVYLRSSSTGTQWNLVSTGTQTVSNTDVRDSNACGGDTIDAIDGTSQDSTHNDCWNINTISMSISDTTIGFGACTSGSARYATGDTNGASSDSADAHTISVATNARGGYSLTVTGSTLTGTGGTITALGGSATASSPGSEQFGARAIKNSGTGTVSSPFDTANWAFTPSTTQTVASYTGASSSYSAAYGLRYICNVAGTTEAGSYSTDLTYILTATF